MVCKVGSQKVEYYSSNLITTRRMHFVNKGINSYFRRANKFWQTQDNDTFNLISVMPLQEKTTRVTQSQMILLSTTFAIYEARYPTI
jgi:hypothetical protein